MRKNIKGYYFITDSGLSLARNEEDVKSAVKAGVSIVQYRAKEADGKVMLLEAGRLKALCGGALFIVNDRIDIALACGSDGVHLGQEDIPCSVARKLLGADKIIGVTVHNATEAKQAIAGGADYIAVAPVFETGTKKDAGKPTGTKLISELKIFAGVPLAAIGGINLSNAVSVIEAGADAVCAISCVVTKENAGAEMRKFQELFSKYSNKGQNK